MLQNPFWNKAVHTSMWWSTTWPVQYLFASHNLQCLRSLFTHPPSQEVWEQSRAFHELYFSSGHCLKMLWANTGYLNGAAVRHLYSLKFSSKPWWLEQRPGKSGGFLLPESGPQVASGKDRPHILSHPLWRWPCDITCCVKKLYGTPRQCVSGLQKAARGENRFEKSPGLEGSLKHRDGGKGLHFASQLTSHRRFNAAVTLKKVSIKKGSSPWDFRLKSGGKRPEKHALGLEKKHKQKKKLMSSQHGYHFLYEHWRKHELRSIFFFLNQTAARRSLRRADATKGRIIGHELSEMCN